jgi:hypothetical protein
MELDHKQARGALVLGPELTTQCFRPPSGKQQRPKGKLCAVRELDAEVPGCHDVTAQILNPLPYLARLC